MSVSANATRLTSLMMAPHFEETTLSLIKNSDSFSLAHRFPLPFHQGLGVAFKILHAKITFKKISKEIQKKSAAVLVFDRVCKITVTVGTEPIGYHI